MNYCVISGKIVGNIESDIEKEMSRCSFNLDNLYYTPTKSATERTIIRCVCYGALADYVYHELYDGANVIVTGRVLNRHYVANNTSINRLYIGCNTVSRLEQEEYC